MEKKVAFYMIVCVKYRVGAIATKVIRPIYGYFDQPGCLF